MKTSRNLPNTDRLAEARRCLAELKRDRTTRGVSPRHQWECAYWRARDNIANVVRG
jgi:hypothetical protein